LGTPSALPHPNWSQEEILADVRGPLHPLAIQGIQAFNRGDYFAAHEDLEIAWREEAGPLREVYRGILQIGLAYYHIIRGNFPGAVKMFQRSKPWLAPFPAYYRGINIFRLRTEAAQAETELLSLGPEKIKTFNRVLMKPVAVEESPIEDGH
jgi:hypothetical protein